MSLRDIAAKAQQPVDISALLDQAKADIEALVAECVKLGSEATHIRVPYAIACDVQAWVESEGVRCACEIQPGKIALLTLIPGRAPPAPPTPEEVRVRAEKDAAIIAASEFARAAGSSEAEARFAALEAKFAALEGGK